MALDLGELIGSLRLDTTPFNLAAQAGEQRAAAAGKKIKDELDVKAKAKVDIDVDAKNLEKAKKQIADFKVQAKSDLAQMGVSVGSLMTKAGAAGPAIMAVGSALSAVASGGVQLLSAVGPAAAGGLAAYAGGFLAVQSATALTKFGLEGVADAAAGDEEAFKALSPAGQKLATTLGDLDPRLEAIRNRVQAGLFPGLSTAIEMLADDYLPMLKDAAGQTSSVLGSLAVDAAKVADTPAFKSEFGTIVDGNAKTLGFMGGAAISLASGAVTLFASAQPLINTFFRWAEGAAGALDSTIKTAEASGSLAAFWDKAANRGATLWGIATNLATAFGNIFSIGADDAHGGKMLKTAERVTAEFVKWTDSSSGATKIAGWFSQGQASLSAMWRLLTAVSGGLADIGSGAQLAPLIDQVTNQVIPPLMEFLDNASASGALGALVTAVGEVIQVFANLSENDSSLYAFADTLSFLAQTAQLVTEHVPGASTALGAFFTAVGVGSALKLAGLGGLMNLAGSGLSFLATKLLLAAGAQTTETGAITLGTAARGIQTGMIGTWIGVKALEAAAWTRSAAAATAASVRTAAAWVLSGGAAMATYVTGMAVAVATTVAGWVVMGAQALAQAARVAAAWLIAMGPIGLVIAAVVGVGILIYKNWDKIKEWTGAAWDWVVNKVKQVPALLIALFQNFTLPGLIIKHWDTIKSATSAVWSAIVGFVKSIPGKLLSFFLNWTIAGQFIKHWDAMRNGAMSKGAAIVSWVAGLPGRIVGALASLGGQLLSVGQKALASLQQGAASRIGAVLGWFGGLAGRLVGAIPNPLGILSAVGGFIIQGLKSGIDAAAHLVTDAVAAIINKIPKKVRDIMGIGSPSKVMRAIAQWIPVGLALGIADGSQGVEDVITKLTDKIEAQFTKDADETESRLKKKYRDLAKNIKKTLDGEAEKKALRKNDDAEEQAIKNAGKARRDEHKKVLDLIAAQAPAIRANGAAQDDVTKKLEEQSGILQNMKQQAFDYAASVRDSFSSFGSITGGGSDEFTSVEDLIAKREAAATKADQFAAAIDQLRGRLNENDLKDLIAKGPDALTVAQGIAAGGGDAINALNTLQARLVSSGQALGDRVADTLYAAGILSQQNLVNGLTADLAGLEAAGVALGNALLAGISKAMEGIGKAIKDGTNEGTKDKDGKVKHHGGKVGDRLIEGARGSLGVRSPSTVFRQIGGYVVDGMILGLTDRAAKLDATVSDVMGLSANASMSVGVASSPAPVVPMSAEVARYAAQQGAAPTQEFNIYETTNPQATAAEVSRRQAYAGAAG